MDPEKLGQKMPITRSTPGRYYMLRHTHHATYIKNISELTTRLLRPLGIRVAHKPTSTLRQLLTRTKGPLPAMGRTNVIYKIPSRDCDKHYIGQTGRKLATR
eukprot:g43286.t1